MTIRLPALLVLAPQVYYTAAQLPGVADILADASPVQSSQTLAMRPRCGLQLPFGGVFDHWLANAQPMALSFWAEIARQQPPANAREAGYTTLRYSEANRRAIAPVLPRSSAVSTPKMTWSSNGRQEWPGRRPTEGQTTGAFRLKTVRLGNWYPPGNAHQSIATQPVAARSGRKNIEQSGSQRINERAIPKLQGRQRRIALSLGDPAGKSASE